MKTITKKLFTIILLLTLLNCSSDDSNSENNNNNTSENLPDNLFDTTWRNIENGNTHDMHFLKSNNPGRMQIGSVFGAYTYDKPNLTLELDDNCFSDVFNTEFFPFNTCSLSGVVSSNSITIINQGREFKFSVIENEAP